MDVDRDRLRADIARNAEFGAIEVASGRGRTVFCGTEANRQAREHLLDRLEAAGLDVRVDAVGNIAGRWTPPGADPDAAPVAAGSHLDSVPAGGIFDGPLGVYAALEAVRAMQDGALKPDRPVEVVCFTEEEGGRFGSGLLGSSVAAGVRSVDDALSMADADGVTLAEGLDRIGFRGEGRLDATTWDAWIELHIEQGSRLEAAGVPVGVVTSIAGITHAEVTLRGEADHAGATPMEARRDALAAAATFILEVESAANRLAGRGDGTAVATVGRVDVEPNATNVVPGRVTLGLDVRDVTPGGIEELLSSAADALDELAADRGVDASLDRSLDVDPSPMNERVRTAAHATAERLGIETMDLHSGAAHDSMHVAGVTDAGMLFAPSDAGVSHSPLEWTDWDDCATATRALAGAMATLAAAT